MDFNAVCRTCLGMKQLNPIFKNRTRTSPTVFSVTLLKITGLKVAFDDGLPQNICKECLKQLKRCLTFREQCKKSHNKIMRILQDLHNPETEILNEFVYSHKDIMDCEDIIKTEIPEEIEYLDTDIHEILPIVEMFQEKQVNDDLLNRNKGENNIANNTNNETNKKSQHLKSKLTKKKHKLKTKATKKNEKTGDVDLNNKYTRNNNNVRVTNTDTTPKNNTTNIATEQTASDFKDLGNETQPDTATENIDLEFVASNAEETTEIPPGISDKSDITKTASDTNLENQVNRINCEICYESLAVRSLRYHMNKKHPDINKVMCELCDMYVAKERLESHVNTEHGLNCRCKYCQQELKTKEMLIKHVATCKLETKSTLKKLRSMLWGKESTECEVCNKKMQRASLKLHIKIKHAGLGPVCDYCGQKLGNKFRLNEHMRSKHGYAKFKCSQCDFQSATTVALANHERRHRGEKPFVCEQCGVRFHAAYLLAQHRQSHRTERLLKCDLCPASFKSNNSLHGHRAACHGAGGVAGGARLACALCPRAFSSRHYAVRHMRAVHRYTGAVPALQLRQDRLPP